MSSLASLSSGSNLKPLTVLWAAAILWMGPRFARSDSVLGWSFQEYTTFTLGDAVHYVDMVQYYRGLGPPCLAPFSLRPLTPFLASFLPLEPYAALAVVSAVGVLIAIAAMHHLTRHICGDDPSAFLATLTFSLSFPVFYYATPSMVEGLTLGFATLSVLMLVQRRFLLAVLAALFAAGNKEVGIVVIGFGVPYLLLEARGTIDKRLFRAAVYAAAALFGWYLSRKLAPPDVSSYTWPMDWSWVVFNTDRIRTRWALALSFGIQGYIVFYVWLRQFQLTTQYIFDPFKWGAGTCAALMVYGYLTGQTDGRFIWYSQIFTTPVLAAIIARNWASHPRLSRLGNH